MSSRRAIPLRLHLLSRRAAALRLRPDDKPSRPPVGPDATQVPRDPCRATVPSARTSARLPERLLDQQELDGSRKGAVGGAPTRGSVERAHCRIVMLPNDSRWMPVVRCRGMCACTSIHLSTELFFWLDARAHSVRKSRN